MQKAEVQVEKGAERAEVAAKDLGDSAKQAANTAMEKVDDASMRPKCLELAKTRT